MNTPVSFQLASLLKEKGFDIPCREGWVNYLKSFTGETRMPDYESNLVMDRLGNSHLIERPTISQVVMWLYEKHKIWISVDPDNDIDTWFYTISHGTSTTVFGNYSGPIEVYEKGIEHVLNSMI